MNKLYKFYNKNASSVRALMVAKCPWLDNSNDPLAEELSSSKQSFGEVPVLNETEPTPTTSAGNPLSHAATLRRSQRSATPEYLLDILQQSVSTSTNTITSFGNISNHNDSTIRYLDEFRREYPKRHICQRSLHPFPLGSGDSSFGVPLIQNANDNSVPGHFCK